MFSVNLATPQFVGERTNVSLRTFLSLDSFLRTLLIRFWTSLVLVNVEILSTKTTWPSLALRERATFRDFLFILAGSSKILLIPLGPWVTPPPTKIGALLAPCLAPPVPFCLYHFFFVLSTSDLV